MGYRYYSHFKTRKLGLKDKVTWSLLQEMAGPGYDLVKRKSEKNLLVIQSCPTLCDPIDCGPLRFKRPGTWHLSIILQARILEWVAVSFFLQGIFLTHGLNLGLLQCRQILYCLSHQGKCGPGQNGYPKNCSLPTQMLLPG